MLTPAMGAIELRVSPRRRQHDLRGNVEVRFIRFEDAGGVGLSVEINGALRGLHESDTNFPGALSALDGKGRKALANAADGLAAGASSIPARRNICRRSRLRRRSSALASITATIAPKSGFKQPDYPTLFTRFATSLVPTAPGRAPESLRQVRLRGRARRRHRPRRPAHPRENALDHVAGYSIFNDVSVRDYQFKTPQWTVGKNFDGTGPSAQFLSPPTNCPPAPRVSGLTRLNGQIMQDGNTDDMVFDVAILIATISEAITLEAGDIIVTGTPAGVGQSRKPPVFMKAGDRVEVEIEKIGTLSNPIVDE